MPVRNVKAKHTGFFPSDPIGNTRRAGSKKRVSLVGAVKTRASARIVFENVFLSLKEISAKSGVSESFLRVSFKRWFGVSFTEYQKHAREKFILKNSNKPNTWLCENLGITKTTLSYLIKDLKKSGAIVDKNRVAVGRKDKLPLSYKPMAHEVMRLLFWSGANFSVPEISEVLNRSKNNVSAVLKDLIKEGLVRRVGKVGQRTYFTFTKDSAVWLKKMETERTRRDLEAMKDLRAIPGLIERKEVEKNRLNNLMFFFRRKGSNIVERMIREQIQKISVELVDLRKKNF